MPGIYTPWDEGLLTNLRTCAGYYDEEKNLKLPKKKEDSYILGKPNKMIC